jgi:hypothetical protein
LLADCSLQQVIRPENSGAGFADVGALAKPKEALREVVQLPLQHPELFLTGSLARHTKGVLLFGPPGLHFSFVTTVFTFRSGKPQGLFFYRRNKHIEYDRISISGTPLSGRKPVSGWFSMHYDSSHRQIVQCLAGFSCKRELAA